jgi:hypothetical protein
MCSKESGIERRRTFIKHPASYCIAIIAIIAKIAVIEGKSNPHH